MRFRPRHYALIVVILALGAWNFFRTRHAATPTSPNAKILTRGTSPTWALFDDAAKLRDASDDQFGPALKSLTDATSNAPAMAIPTDAATSSEATDLNGCRTWLLFYRSEHLHPTSKPGWLAQTQQHVDSCVSNHQDIAL